MTWVKFVKVTLYDYNIRVYVAIFYLFLIYLYSSCSVLYCILDTLFLFYFPICSLRVGRYWVKVKSTYPSRGHNTCTGSRNHPMIHNRLGPCMGSAHMVWSFHRKTVPCIHTGIYIRSHYYQLRYIHQKRNIPDHST